VTQQSNFNSELNILHSTRKLNIIVLG